MGRTAGKHNADYDKTRASLLKKLSGALLQPQGQGLSFRELASAAGVSPPTLRHYFGSRDRALTEVLEHLKRSGEPFLAAAASAPVGDVQASLLWLLQAVIAGWHFGVGATHALGLGAGMGHATLGPAYLNKVLEPTLAVVESRLSMHVQVGELRPCDVRTAALSLVSPVIVALLHQQMLGGDSCRALDMDAFVSEHLDGFLRAYRAKVS